MEKKLRKVVDKGLYHFVDGVRIAGAPSGLRGNVDECGLTEEERNEGVDVNVLVGD